MALTPQVIDIPFEGGLDTQTDPKKVVPGKLLELENAVFVGGSIELRPGTAAMPDTVVGGGTLTTALGLATRGAEILRWTSGGVYGLSSTAAGQWSRRADTVEAKPLAYDISKVVQRSRSALNFDSASALGLTAYAWCELNPPASGTTTGEKNVRVTVLDDVTGTKYHDATLIFSESTTGTAATQPIQLRLLACGGQFLLFYVSGAQSPGVITVNSAKLAIASPVSSWASTAITTTISRDSTKDYQYTFDVIDTTPGVATTSTTGTLVLAYGATDGVRASFISTPPGSTTYTYLGETLRVPQTGSASATQYQDVRLSRLADLTRVFVVFTQTATGRLETHALDSTTRAAVGTGDLGAHVTGRIAFVEQSPGVVTVAIERTGESPTKPTMTASFTGNAATTAQVPVAYGLRLIGDGFALNGSYVVPCAVMDTWKNIDTGPDLPGVQPAIVLLDVATSRVVARALVGQAGVPFLGSSLVQRPSIRADGSVWIAVPIRGTLVVNVISGVLVDETPFGLARMSIRSADVDRLCRSSQSCLHVGGACPVIYDGGSWVEDGFTSRPEGVSVAIDASKIGGLSAGTYSWVVCYEWRDGAGQLHRSSPSVPVSLTSDGTQAQSAPLLKIPYLALSRRRGVTLVLYRTTANGIIYYRVGLSKDAVQNPDPGVSPALGYASLYDLIADSSIITNSVLPFTGTSGGSAGGELYHVPTSGYSAICRHRDYLFVNTMDDGYTYGHSLPLVDGQAPAWPVEFQYRVPTTHGRIVGMASLENVLVLLAERGCYIVQGEGPSAGGGAGFSTPAYITGSVGCLVESSITITPDGIMYQAADGFYILSRALESVKIGGPVDAYSKLSVSRGLEARVPATTDNPSGRREVRWYTRDGITLVYSSTYQQWAVWTGQPARGAVSHSGVVYFADSALVRAEDASLQTEVGAAFTALVGTAWMTWGGLQGVQRLWKVHLLGQALVTVTVTAQVYYDYDELTLGSTQTKTFPGFSVGGPRAFEMRQTLSRQRAESLRFRFLLVPAPTTTSDKGRIRLSAMSMEVGVTKTLYKRRASPIGP